MSKESVQDVVESILQDAAEGVSSFAWPFEAVRSTVGDPPQDWIVIPPRGREHPEYVFAALAILMTRGLIVSGDRLGGAFVLCDEPVDVQIAHMRQRFNVIPGNRPVLPGDVANFVVTPGGRYAMTEHSTVLGEVAEEIERAWVNVDEGYGRERPASDIK
jgi:hypothetical protein